MGRVGSGSNRTPTGPNAVKKKKQLPNSLTDDDDDAEDEWDEDGGEDADQPGRGHPGVGVGVRGRGVVGQVGHPAGVGRRETIN